MLAMNRTHQWLDKHEYYDLSTWALECLLHILRMTLYQILTQDLNTWQASLTRVPYMLTKKQLNQRVQLEKDFLKRFDKEPTFLDGAITCDETWIHHFDSPSKRCSEIWKWKELPHWKNIQQQKCASKIRMITFWD